jgi:spore maturation protein CgeB
MVHFRSKTHTLQLFDCIGGIKVKILALMTFDIFIRSLGEALESLGHAVSYLREFEEAELEEAIRHFQPDMVVDMGWDVWHQKYAEEGTLPVIKSVLERYGLFHVYFAEEDWLHFDRWSKRYVAATAPNFVLTRSHGCIPKYREMGIDAAYFDVGCNPEFHKAYPSRPEYECDVALIANGNFNWGEIRYKSVHDLVIPLIDEGFDTKIWGDHWTNLSIFYPGKTLPDEMVRGKIDFNETPHVYSSAKICLSVQTSRDQLSNRTLDIMACGGFLLTSDTEAVRSKLLPGFNCEVTGSPAETVEKINYYLQNDTARREIAENGRRCAIERFTYQKQLMEVWPEVEREFTLFKLRLERDVLTAKGGAMQSPNRISNGDFQSEEWDPWLPTNTTRNDTVSLSGSKCAEFAGGMTNAFIQQYVPVEQGKVYQFSASFARLGEGKPAFVSIMIQYFTADNVFITSALQAMTYCDVENAADLGWLPLRAVTIAAPETAGKALIIINKLPVEDAAPIVVADCVFMETQI